VSFEKKEEEYLTPKKEFYFISQNSEIPQQNKHYFERLQSPKMVHISNLKA
jgi:hypothetical protein